MWRRRAAARAAASSCSRGRTTRAACPWTCCATRCCTASLPSLVRTRPSPSRCGPTRRVTCPVNCNCVHRVHSVQQSSHTDTNIRALLACVCAVARVPCKSRVAVSCRAVVCAGLWRRRVTGLLCSNESAGARGRLCAVPPPRQRGREVTPPDSGRYRCRAHDTWYNSVPIRTADG